MALPDLLPGEQHWPAVPDFSWLDVTLGPRADWKKPAVIGGLIGIAAASILAFWISARQGRRAKSS